MSYAHLILCERTSRWAVAWRRALAGRLRVIETRAATHCEEQLAAYSASIVGIEMAPGKVQDWGPRLVAWREAFPDCLLLALGGEELTFWDLYLREAGAHDVVKSRRQLHKLAPLALRHARRFPTPPPAWKQDLWSKLPWSDLVGEPQQTFAT